MLRGFYALERNRTVFCIQCVMAAVNVVVAAVLLRRGHRTARDGPPALAGAYLVGVRRRLGHLLRLCSGSGIGGLGTRWLLVRFGVRMVIVDRGRDRGGVLCFNALLLREPRPGAPTRPPARGSPALLLLLVVAVDVAVFSCVARMLWRIREVTTVLETVLGPLLRRRRRAPTGERPTMTRDDEPVAAGS